MKEDIADKLQRDFEESEYAVFFALLRIAFLSFFLGLVYLSLRPQ